MAFDQRSERGRVSALKERPPSAAVVRAVADAAGVDQTDIPPLNDVVDPDALNALFLGRAPGSVTFEYGGYTVTVREDAELIVQESASPDG